MWRFCLILVCLAVCLCRVEGAEQERVRLGADAKTVVIVGSGGLLKRGLERCLGVECRSVAAPDYQPGPGEVAIYVGDTSAIRDAVGDAAQTLDPEGYIIQVEANRVFLFAAQPPATDTGNPVEWVQLDFLRRFLNVDHYFPGALGEVYPRRDSVEIPLGTWVETPVFLYRQWSGLAGKAQGWRVRASGGGGRYRFHHHLYEIISPKTYAAHPGYFPVIYEKGYTGPRNPSYGKLEPGERYLPPAGRSSYWQPCTSNPEVVRIAVEAALKGIAAHPENPVFSLGVNDSGGHCHCAECLADSPPGVEPASDAADGYRMYRFYNEVARRVAEQAPNARLGFLAYQVLNRWKPEKLHPALIPFVTLSMADNWDAESKAGFWNRIDWWKGRVGQFGVYDWMFGQGFIVPRLYLREEAEGIRRLRDLGCRGYYAEGYANWGLDGPKLWVMERLLWNPDEDLDRLLDQWSHNLFGEKAGAEMRRYFNDLETAWATQKPGNAKRGGYRLHGLTGKAEQLTEIFPPAVCDAAWERLLAAERLAESPEALARVRYFKAAFALPRFFSHRYAAGQQAEALKGQDFNDPETLRALAKAYGDWREIGPEGPLFEAVRTEAPLAFQEQAQQEAGAGKDFADRLKAWDSDFPLQTRLGEALVDAALRTAPSPTVAAVDVALERVVEGVADSAPLRDALLKLARGMILVARPTAEPLSLAKRDTWGKPSFDGALVDYPSLTKLGAYRTQFWLRYDADFLYIGAWCEQPEEAFGSVSLSRDAVEVKDNGVLDIAKYDRHFPYLYPMPETGVRLCNSVGVSLEGVFLAMVTAEGSLFDARSSSFGLLPGWNGAEAETVRTSEGWSAVIRVARYSEGMGDLLGNDVVRQFNLFRVTANQKAAVIPGLPRWWAINPRSGGFFLLEQ